MLQIPQALGNSHEGKFLCTVFEHTTMHLLTSMKKIIKYRSLIVVHYCMEYANTHIAD